MPKPNPNSNDARSMFLNIYGDTGGSNTDKINQMSELNKQLNKEKREQDELFHLILTLLAKEQFIDLKQQLLEKVQNAGFSDLPSALNLMRNQYGQSPLEHAFQQQYFGLAKLLISLGSLIGPREKAAFEVALDSKAARDFGFTLPAQEEKLHTVKNFGLVLGIKMTSQDGTHSQYAHIAPTYQLMTDSVTEYASKNPAFKEIADAFSFSNKAAAFSYSTSKRNPKAGEEIAERIQSGKVTTIPIGCKGHVMGLSVVPDGPGSNSGYLVYTNRGVGSNPRDYGTHIYRMDDLSKVNPKFINTVMNGLGDGASHEAMMGKIQQVTDGKRPIHRIEQGGQKNDNCTIANPRANIQGILLCQKAIANNGFDKLEKNDFDAVKADYKAYTGHMRTQKVNELATALEKNPKNVDLNNLAKEYLKQHKDAAPHLTTRLNKALHTGVRQEASNTQTYQSKPSW